MAISVHYLTVALLGLLTTQTLAIPNGGGHDHHDHDHYYQVDYHPPQPKKHPKEEKYYEMPKKVHYVKVTYLPPKETPTICCTGTVTIETTTAVGGPTYIIGTTVFNEIEYVTYYVTDNSTISSVAATAVNSTYITNPVTPTLPSTAIAPSGWRTINPLEFPCATTKITRTLKFDPVLNTAVYNRERVETAFTIPPTPTPTPEPEPTPTPEPEPVAPPPPPPPPPNTTTEAPPPPPPTAAAAGGVMVRVSKMVGALAVGAAIAFVL